MVTFKYRGDFNKTERFFHAVLKRRYLKILDKYGQMGVSALAESTPKETGATASAWAYEINIDRSGATIGFYNTNENHGVNIVMLLRFGHGTGTGGFVAGRDFISPAVQPIFDEMADAAWKEVTEL